MVGTVIPTAATLPEFEAFLDKFKLEVQVADREKLLNLSFAFMSNLDFCTTGNTVEGQCFIAYALTEGFDPVSPVDGRNVVERSIGRNAVSRRWTVDATMSGTSAVALLRRVPMAFNALEDYLCKESLVVDSANSIKNIDVFR